MRTTVSTPGKALVAGGYLVLDPAYFGVVFATDARFYTVVEAGSVHPTPRIRVRSPQFFQATWTYEVEFPSTDSVDKATEGLRLVQM